jgi:hypothetical protein
VSPYPGALLPIPPPLTKSTSWIWPVSCRALPPSHILRPMASALRLCRLPSKSPSARCPPSRHCSRVPMTTQPVSTSFMIHYYIYMTITNKLYRASTLEPPARTQCAIRCPPAPNASSASRLRLRPHITIPFQGPPLLNLLRQLQLQLRPNGPLRISRT